MEFPTIKFAYFALVVLTVSWALTQNRTVQKVFLLGASYFFAWKFKPEFLAVLVLSSLANWYLGKTLVRLKGDKKQKSVLVFGILLNLGVLGFFKYYGFFIDNLGSFLTWLDLEVHLPILEVIAPFGISFFTFQSMSYLVDTYWDKAVQPASLLDYLLFIAFFPQYGAGPICSSKDLLPQLAAPAPKQIPDLSNAVGMIATGLLKKMVFASYLASHLTTDAFLSPQNFTAAELILAVYAYTAQVYLDFSGYTDIARGVSLLFGFKIPENFNYPYCATDIGDFWRRWHMTFSRWLRFYIYFPLGGSKCSRARCYFNLMVTFVACGIWHGPTWGFVIWGTLHGIALTAYKAALDLRRDLGIKSEGPYPWWWLALGCFSTVSFCAFARVFFKASDLTTAMDYYAGLTAGTLYGEHFDLGVLFVTLLTFFLNFYGRPIFDAFVSWHEKLPHLARPFAWAGILALLFTLKPFGMAATIYFNF
ncbi:MAG: MBOAT family O-acyltransferase [Myxococcota bacterium]|nr:MBOAT family O-acyltransferase [Myxococcota bacterium]